MKKKEVIDKILQYHPHFPVDYNGCDDYKYGSPEEKCTGIATAITATPDVIKKAGDIGCNLLIVHEPTFYSTRDYPDWRAGFPNKIYEEKCRMLDQYHITIWRDHDHMHAHQPDSIFTGVIKYLGWEEHQIKTDSPVLFTYFFRFEDMTVGKMKKELIDRLNLNGIRYIGRPEATIRTVAFTGHLCPNAMGTDFQENEEYYHEYAADVIQMMENGVDAIIPGEVIDWTVISYIRDAVQMGKNLAAFNVGHFNWEELGMRYARDWISEIVEGKLPVYFIPAGDIYQF